MPLPPPRSTSPFPAASSDPDAAFPAVCVCEVSMAAVPNDDKPEPVPLDEAAVVPEVPVKGEVEVPYSIYTNREKWMIVAMVALAGFYR